MNILSDTETCNTDCNSGCACGCEDMSPVQQTDSGALRSLLDRIWQSRLVYLYNRLMYCVLGKRLYGKICQLRSSADGSYVLGYVACILDVALVIGLYSLCVWLF